MNKKKGIQKAKKRFLVLAVFFVGLVGLSVATIFGDWLQIMSNKQEIAFTIPKRSKESSLCPAFLLTCPSTPPANHRAIKKQPHDIKRVKGA